MISVTDTVQLAQKIRKDVLMMTHLSGGSHVASALSMTDLLAVLYGRVLRFNPAQPDWSERDRFILSKGHAVAALYSALASVGFVAKDILKTYGQNGSTLGGHATYGSVPGIEFSSGSLGHGLPVGAGMAYAGRLAQKQYRIFVLMSDGECDEGSNWEAILFAGHHQLDNLVAIIDYNKMQALGMVGDILDLEPFAEKWRSFGWQVIEVDGHNHESIFQVCAKVPLQRGRPSCIIAHTVKGKGVSFMENNVLWHYRSPQGEVFERAMQELESLEHML